MVLDYENYEVVKQEVDLAFVIFGILMSIVGVVGLYVGRTFDETKSRPVYIIDKQTYRPNK
jgi:dolichol-phosphate mannosyltransferase